MTQAKRIAPFDGAELLGAFREYNRCAVELAKDADEVDDAEEFSDALNLLSRFTHEAADAAQSALDALTGDDPDPTSAKQFLDRAAHVFGMMSLATTL